MIQQNVRQVVLSWWFWFCVTRNHNLRYRSQVFFLLFCRLKKTWPGSSDAQFSMEAFISGPHLKRARSFMLSPGIRPHLLRCSARRRLRQRSQRVFQHGFSPDDPSRASQGATSLAAVEIYWDCLFGFGYFHSFFSPPQLVVERFLL